MLNIFEVDLPTLGEVGHFDVVVASLAARIPAAALGVTVTVARNVVLRVTVVVACIVLDLVLLRVLVMVLRRVEKEVTVRVETTGTVRVEKDVIVRVAVDAAMLWRRNCVGVVVDVVPRWVDIRVE